jgi:multiple sugar transport system substrate-binding protein
MVVTTANEVDVVLIGSEEAARGLDIARRLITDGVAPLEVVDFREAEALNAFMAGEAVFLRTWPYAYGILRQAGFTVDQIGVASLPAAAAGGRNASCLGGWNLMLNARSSEAERDAAWVFARYLTDPAQQRSQALEAGLLPVLEALYDDSELAAAVPVIGVGTEVFATQLRTRPETPFYSELSARVASTFNRMLRGEISGAEATALLERELREIVVRNR